MAEIVNLRTARKRKARAAAEQKADENRSLHGRSKAEKHVETARRTREAATLDGHRREKPDGDDA